MSTSLLLCSVLFACSIFHSVFGISCYLCHQTSSACKYGDKSVLRVQTCKPEEVCGVFQYSSHVKDGHNVTATIRECGSKEFCKDKNNLPASENQKLIYCNICNETLCNTSSSVGGNTLMWIIVGLFSVRIVL